MSNCRLDWSSSVSRGVTIYRKLELDRLDHLCSMSRLYLDTMETNTPKLVNVTKRLREPVGLCDTSKDTEVKKASLSNQTG